MGTTDLNFHNKIAKLCFEHFNLLPKCGKPKENEWTILSCIVQEDEDTANSSFHEKNLLGSDEFDDVEKKKIKLEENDIYRTGAKCLESDVKQDLHLEGINYHVTGVVRIKPGRGVRTLSVSCSDKLAKWCHLGIQGALLSILLKEPIYLSSFTIAGGTPFDKEAMERALFHRLGDVQLEHPYHRSRMILEQASFTFSFSKSDEKKPCPSSITWLKINNSKKIQFVDDLSNLSYKNAKLYSKQYQKSWTILKKSFKVWTVKIGTFQIRGRSLIRDVLNYALAAGYRQIDTAAVYGNEEDIAPSDQGDSALRALENSVRNLDCGYLDLYLIHWPGAHGVPGNHPNNIKLRTSSWTQLIKGVQQGLVKDIGVSNYTIRHLNEILSKNYDIKPAVNQVEWHPHCHQSDLKKFCEKEGILLQAYSSLGGSNNPKLISDPVVVEIAKKLEKSPAQVLLQWALQQKVGIIPKARSREHIEANIDLNFTISDEDMNRLSSLKTEERYAWDPKTII
ncbi:prostaglandin F synthase-like [Asbolus verrucosus]|uniref:Prostaglandin F synthase-like n=1 Tax=Asbolus verrucosus TaxID=1661398 RepID=A0A482W5Q2_ASBVE|nr:prostaglandin F synthase-like [Asbolus verrucosus]